MSKERGGRIRDALEMVLFTTAGGGAVAGVTGLAFENEKAAIAGIAAMGVGMVSGVAAVVLIKTEQVRLERSGTKRKKV